MDFAATLILYYIESTYARDYYLRSTDKDMQVVEKNVRKKSLNTWYEAQLLTDNGKSKRVYCYISPRVRKGVK